MLVLGSFVAAGRSGFLDHAYMSASNKVLVYGSTGLLL